MDDTFSLKEALIKFYKDEGIQIYFSYNCRIKAAGVYFKKYKKSIIKYFFVVPIDNAPSIGEFDFLVDSFSHVFSLSNVCLTSSGEIRTSTDEVVEFYYEEINRYYLRFNNPYSKKNRKSNRVQLNKYKRWY